VEALELPAGPGCRGRAVRELIRPAFPPDRSRSARLHFLSARHRRSTPAPSLPAPGGTLTHACRRDTLGPHGKPPVTSSVGSTGGHSGRAYTPSTPPEPRRAPPARQLANVQARGPRRAREPRPYSSGPTRPSPDRYGAGAGDAMALILVLHTACIQPPHPHYT